MGANFFEIGVNSADIPSFFLNIEAPCINDCLFLEVLKDSYFFYNINDWGFKDFFDVPIPCPKLDSSNALF